MNPGDRITCPNGFGWIIETTRHREPGLPGEHVLLIRDPSNNPSPYAYRQWMAPDTLRSQYKPAEQPESHGEGLDAVASTLESDGLGGLDRLRETQARRRAEGRI